MAQYITRDGDTVDYIAWKHYGTTGNRVVEKMLEANKGLAGRGAVLVAGVTIELPDIDLSVKKSGVKLWD